MKKLIYILIIILAASGCDKFLDVNPRSKFTDADMFSSAEGIEDALYGVYAYMASTDALYGSTLSIAFPEFSSGNFYVINTSAGEGFLAYGNWEYYQTYSIIRNTWEKAYAAIGYANNIVNHFEDGDVAESRYHDIYFGEALALRALMHFDLLRIYGPANWSSDADKSKVIPYVKRYSYEITPYGSWEEVYDNIIDDLVKAEGLLYADENLMSASRNNIANGFTSCRTTHLNLYAVQALLARVYWTKGDLANASIYADKVIKSGKFPLMEVGDFINFERGAFNMKETIFGLYSTSYASKCNGYFQINASAIEMADYTSLYAEQGPDPGVDYRRTYWFDQNACIKMVNTMYVSGSSTYTGPSILGVNILRIPEMYYIMAEYYLENNNVGKAVEYIDYVIESRGMIGFADRMPVALTMDDIYNEYRKEFYGEGQQWYNMKRLKKNIKLKNSTITGGDEIYRVMIPPTVENDLRDE